MMPTAEQIAYWGSIGKLLLILAGVLSLVRWGLRKLFTLYDRYWWWRWRRLPTTEERAKYLTERRLDQFRSACLGENRCRRESLP